MSNYCAQTCGRCNAAPSLPAAACFDVAPPGGFTCAQQVSRHCEPAASCKWYIVSNMLCTAQDSGAWLCQGGALLQVVAVGKAPQCLALFDVTLLLW